MLRHLLLCLLIVLPSAALASDLTHGEIEDELVGRQIAWWEMEGWRHGHLFLLPNGAAEMTVERPRAQHDVGRWSLRGDQVCTRWGEARSGIEKCYRIRRGEDGVFVTTGGNVFEIRELGV
jgi:hypothetical protein